ncbi:EpsG family protein [Clostridium perfringens]|nr:EpsG family protein [Clostridium perfringens]
MHLGYRILFIYAFVINWINSGLRYGVGTDFFSYLNHYNYAKDIKIYDNEPIYILSVRLLKLVFGEYSQIFFIISSFIILYFIYKICVERVEYYELGVFLFITLYFYYSSLNLVRQWIAVSIILYSYKYIFQKNLKRYLIAVLIAILIHNTAIVAIPLYFLINLDIKKFTSKIIILSIVSLTIFSRSLLNLIFYILSKFDIGDYYKYELSNQINQNAGSAYFIIAIVVLSLYFITNKKNIQNGIYNKFELNLLISIAIFSFLGSKSMIFGRVQMYITPYIVFIIPQMISNLDKRNRIFFYYILIFFGVLYMSRSLLINGGQVVPYNYCF